MSIEFKAGVRDVAGHEVAYREAGSGPPVVLLHGITTYSFIWQRVMPLLQGDYRVIAPDLLGCGLSDKRLDVPYSLKSHARTVVGLLDALDIERAHLVGHDVGGGVAQIVAVRHPDRLYDVTLVNPVGYDHWPVQPIKTLRAPIIRQLLMATLDHGSLKVVVRRGLHHKERATPELLGEFWAPMKEARGRKAFLHFARCLDNQDLLEIESDLRTLRVPALIVRGREDVYLSPRITERLAEDIPDSLLVHVDEAGHFLQVDQPEVLVRALLDFFRRPGGSHAS